MRRVSVAAKKPWPRNHKVPAARRRASAAVQKDRHSEQGNYDDAKATSPGRLDHSVIAPPHSAQRNTLAAHSPRIWAYNTQQIVLMQTMLIRVLAKLTWRPVLRARASMCSASAHLYNSVSINETGATEVPRRAQGLGDDVRQSQQSSRPDVYGLCDAIVTLHGDQSSF